MRGVCTLLYIMHTVTLMLTLALISFFPFSFFNFFYVYEDDKFTSVLRDRDAVQGELVKELKAQMEQLATENTALRSEHTFLELEVGQYKSWSLPSRPIRYWNYYKVELSQRIDLINQTSTFLLFAIAPRPHLVALHTSPPPTPLTRMPLPYVVLQFNDRTVSIIEKKSRNWEDAQLFKKAVEHK